MHDFPPPLLRCTVVINPIHQLDKPSSAASHCAAAADRMLFSTLTPRSWLLAIGHIHSGYTITAPHKHYKQPTTVTTHPLSRRETRDWGCSRSWPHDVMLGYQITCSLLCLPLHYILRILPGLDWLVPLNILLSRLDIVHPQYLKAV